MSRPAVPLQVLREETPAPARPAEPPRLIRMHPRDNVAVVVNEGGLPAGTALARAIEPGPTLREAVPQGHKVALVDLPVGAPVRRYGVPIGLASEALPAGSWVHERRLTPPRSTDRTHDDAARTVATSAPSAAAPASEPAPLTGYSFEGYRNADGSVGTRNLLAIATTVQCVAGVLDVAVARIERELLPRYPNVDGVVALEHAYGCGVAIDAPGAEIPIRTLRNLALNPNFGGELMLVSLGCEKLQPERLLPPGSLPAGSAALDHLCLQDRAHVGFGAMIDGILARAEVHLARLDARRRETVPASELVVGMQCGGSDAFSGITANPAVGHCADLLVRAGATVMFSEVTEVEDALDALLARAATPEVAQAISAQIEWYRAYLARGGVDRSANTTPGNKAGGLSNIIEKALGSVVKSGSLPISGVLAPGERARQRGLLFAATPASDFICGTLQLAAGMNLHVFTTGRGTPYGLAACPVVKVATRSELARRWHDLIDLDAGPIATGEASIEQVGQRLFELLLQTASGRRTWAEQHRLHNALVLFNPAPVT